VSFVPEGCHGVVALNSGVAAWVITHRGLLHTFTLDVLKETDEVFQAEQLVLL